MSLNSAQLETLRLVCDTLLPSVDTADDPTATGAAARAT